MDVLMQRHDKMPPISELRDENVLSLSSAGDAASHALRCGRVWPHFLDGMMDVLLANWPDGAVHVRVIVYACACVRT